MLGSSIIISGVSVGWGRNTECMQGAWTKPQSHLLYCKWSSVYGRLLANINGASPMLIDTGDRLAHAAKLSFKRRKAEDMNLQLKYYNNSSQYTNLLQMRKWQQGSFLVRKCAGTATAR